MPKGPNPKRPITVTCERRRRTRAPASSSNIGSVQVPINRRVGAMPWRRMGPSPSPASVCRPPLEKQLLMPALQGAASAAGGAR